MTEYELLDLLGEHTNTVISLLQWWVGITLGILVAVHVIGKGLNGYMASILITLYTAFTAMISVMMSAHDERQRLLVADLEKLQEQGVPIGKMAQYIVESGGPPPFVEIFATVGYWGLIISTIVYTIYCFSKAKLSK